ncbi:MAG: histone deacetylase [Candidatus Omnitrophota bacterium]
MTGFVYSEDYLLHDTGKSHPENPTRLKTIIRKLKASGTYSKLKLIHPSSAPLKWVEKAHTPQYVASLKEKIENGATSLDADTPVCKKSCDIALLAAGGTISAIDAVMEGEVKRAFCALRPPGHHATRNRAMGFCLLNNVAIGAKYLLEKHGVKRILIVDWDVHHGNGTQDIFYADNKVLYFSAHQYPHYPGSGGQDERGDGKGEGYTINAPLPKGCGDEEYKELFNKILVPAAEKFKPEFILISAGFDAHRDDPLAGMNLTEGGFAALTDIVSKIADTYSSGRVVSALEGGYNVMVLGRSVDAHVRALMQ